MPSKPQLARVLLAIVAVAVVVHAEVRGVRQGERITRVEHTHTVELCSTKVSCRHLLDQLLATVRPSDIAKLRRRVHLQDRPASIAPLARHLAQRHTTVPRPTEPRPSSPSVRSALPSSPASPTMPQSAPPATSPKASIAPPPAKTAPVVPTVPTIPPGPVIPTPEPPPHVIETPSGREGPLGLPCVKVAGVEVLCHAAG